MSEENTSPVADNIIPLPVEAVVAPLESSPVEQIQQDVSTGASEIPAVSPTEETPAPGAEEDPVQNIINQVDMSKVSKDEIFMDLIQNAKEFAFRLVVATSLMEHKIAYDKAQAEAPANAEETAG
jgi:hypothetical protein